MKILITNATSAAAYKLKNKYPGDHVLLGDHQELPLFLGNTVKLPNPTSASYQHEMLTLCLDAAVEKVFVMTTEELLLLKESELLFNEYNIEILDGSNAI
ncbi:hypothetical protein DYU05_02120 [Mucilaginibacter terrenus]|uniref:Uncharacterized protein n=1 Tax=Mucilaginibacter terrenus TaxID=2482727 RepID=A0A3E2NTV4_9SPHI|nr:hypothetical protein [Mucilaginibacter terrenus]RFZ84438.1 hypothetical protein DYU05_02120 [Mucilaginibacter terrenus]